MKWHKKIFTRPVKWVLSLLVVASLIAFGSINKTVTECKSIRVDLENNFENHFLDEDEVRGIATGDGEFPLVGKPFSTIDLKQVEERLYDNPFVASCDTYKDLEGNLLIRVKLERPIARVVRQNGPDAYLTKEAKVMPVSDQFVSRVILVHAGKNDSLAVEKYYEKGFGNDLINLIAAINNNDFWKAQLAEIYVNSKNEIQFLPQVTKQIIEFGQPVDIENKLMKLRKFYKEILPVKGWNTYDRVNVEFENQIIAE